jgi:outer membrane lipase/esterase
MDGTHEEVVVSPPIFGDVTITIDDMGKQMDDYLASHVVDPDALYIVWGGSNDLRNDPSLSSVTATAARATALVSRIANAGAKFIMVPNIAPLGDIPRYSDDPVASASHNQAALSYRAELDADLTILQNNLATQGAPPRSIAPMSGATPSSSPMARFGFTNITTSAQDNSSANPDQFIFWDDKHPTTLPIFQLAQSPTTRSLRRRVSSRDIALAFSSIRRRISIAGYRQRHGSQKSDSRDRSIARRVRGRTGWLIRL